MKRLSRLIRHTPLHPQWLALREDDFAIVERVQPRAGDLLLDIGSGRGGLAGKLPEGVEYLSLDYPVTGAARYGSQPSVFGSAECLPVRGGSIDVAVCLEVLEHVPDPARAIYEIGRILKPGGRAAISVPFAYPLHDVPYDFQRLTRFQLARFAQRAGLRVDSLRERGHAIESAALLLNLAIAKSALDGLKRKRVAGLLALLIVFTPFINLLGWLLARASGQCGKNFLPTGYSMLLSRQPLLPLCDSPTQ